MTPAGIQEGLALALRSARKRRGIPLREVVRLSGVHSISRIESGEHAINVRTLSRLAELYGCLPSDLLLAAEFSRQLEFEF
jgi:transcriptional regulator with XRE-family HTH domain